VRVVGDDSLELVLLGQKSLVFGMQCEQLLLLGLSEAFCLPAFLFRVWLNHLYYEAIEML
jgi:hypothetical protein